MRGMTIFSRIGQAARTLGLLIAIATIGLISFVIGLYAWGSWHDEWSGYNASLWVSDGICNIARIPVSGDIYPYETEAGGVTGDAIRQAVAAAEADPYIEGILVTFDSYGGTIAASDLMAETFRTSALPVVGLIREAATSGGYLAAAGTDYLMAAPYSDVGGIGVTMSYLDYTTQNEESGIAYVPLTSAPYKDYGSPDRALTAAERALIERDLSIYHDTLVARIAQLRELPEERVRALADGASMPGTLALEAGLIDALGTEASVPETFAGILERDASEMVICESY
jgi:protease-4